ncbi:MAG: DMT family transporter [Nitratireductor sp.]|nr:DMT family transporter [Nitratireductor sp.]
MTTETNSGRLTAYIVMFFAPLFFSTNVVFGRAATDIAPFTLAFLRWGLAALILLALSRKSWPQMVTVLRSQWKLLMLQGFLGMFICGGLVYLALHETTATNGTLIYTSPPVIIILIERFWRGRKMRAREMAGVLLAVLGVLLIVTRGNLANLVTLQFNSGDLIFVFAAVSWAVYSVILKSEAFAGLSNTPLIALVAAMGAVVLAPFSLAEFLMGEPMPVTPMHWVIIGGIVLLASVMAFSLFQYGVRALGPSLASIFMYMLPPFGVGFAVVFLGESFRSYHALGIAVIMGGVMLATFPARLLRRKA